MAERQVVFISRPDLSFARSIRQAMPKSIVVFWKKGATDLSSAKILAKSCKMVFADSTILPEVASELGNNILALEHPAVTLSIKSIKPPLQNNKRPIAFFASSDTIANFFIPIVMLSYKKSIFIIPKESEEGSGELLASHKLSSVANKIGLLEKLYPSVVVFGNDWSLEEISVIENARRLGIPTICIQEGCLDWHDGRFKRMQIADFVFLLGALSIDYLDRDLYFLTGNPKFDSLQRRPLPQKHLVMINCNFTYNIYENIRDEWITDVVRACKELGVDFFISQHPRDTGALIDLPVRSSNATVIHDQIEESSILISRFSTIIYESVRMGRQAIYYNPHHETMKTFEDDETGGIYKSHSFDDLLIALQQATSSTKEILSQNEKFLTLHCGIDDGLADRRCVESIQEVARFTEMSQSKQLFRRGCLFITGQVSRFINNLFLFVHKFLRMLRSKISKKG